MRYSLFILLSIFFVPSYAQIIDEIQLQVGPKIEYYAIQGISQIRNPGDEIALKTHIDASAGLFAIKNIENNFTVKAGLVKRDFSFRYDIVATDDITQTQQTYFENSVFPSFTSVQAGAGFGYKYIASPRSAFYFDLGFQFYLYKKLTTEGLDEDSQVILNDMNEPVGTITLRRFRNGFGGGNYFIRTDVGYLLSLNDYLIFDLGFNTYFSNLEHHGAR